MKQKFGLKGVFGGIVAIAMVASFGTTASAAPKAQTSSVLNIAVNSGTASLDPAKAGNGDPLQIYYELAYDPLIHRLPSGKLGAGLATSWKYVDKANKVFEFTLRENVKFSDGSTLSAQGVKDHFEYYAKAGGPFASRAKNFEKIEVISPLTVRLTLTKANPDIPDMFTERRATGSIISPLAIKTPDVLGTTTAGAGAYMLDPKQTVTNQTYTYVKNPNYYNKSRQAFQKVVVKVLTNPQAVLNAMQAGQVDYAIGTPQLAPAAIKAGFKVNTFPYNFAQIQFLDRAGVVVEAFGDVRVRQALNYAIDRKALAKALFGKYGSANNQFALPGYDAYDKSLEGMYPYDVNKAKALLKEAGYAAGFSFDLLAFDLQPNEVKNAQAIASYWKKLGVQANIVVPSSAAEYGPMLMSKKFGAQIFEFGGGPLYQTLDQYLGMPFNALGYQDSEVNGLFAKAAAANDTTRPSILKRIQKLLLDEAWFVPFASVNKVTFSRPGLEGTGGAPYYINPNPIFFTVKKK